MGGGGSFSSADSGPKPTPEQLEEMNRTMVRNSQVEVSRLMLGWFAAAHPAAQAEYSYAGEAVSPDGKAFVIEVKNSGTLNARLFIDEETNLPLMVTYRGPQPRTINAGPRQMTQTAGGGGHVVTSGAQSSEEERKKAIADVQKQLEEMQKQPPVMVDYTVFFEDWRDADGVKFPFKMRRAMDGTTTEEWTVNKVKLNPKVDPKRFAGES